MTTEKVDISSVVDNAKFTPFHFNVVAWCLLIILFDGYDLAINGVVLPLLMQDCSGGYACQYCLGRYDVWCDDFWFPRG